MFFIPNIYWLVCCKSLYTEMSIVWIYDNLLHFLNKIQEETASSSKQQKLAPHSCDV